MSFGFSAGDFLATARLIRSIVDALRTSSISDLRELTVELENVQRALYEIGHLQPSPDQELAINSIKIAALLCKHPLDEFAVKIRKYESLGKVATIRADQLKQWRMKLQWGLTMEEEVQRIRLILNAHMASLNVRLSTQGIISASITSSGMSALHEGLANTHEVVLDIERRTRVHDKAIPQVTQFLQSILRIVQDGVLPQMANLLEIANRVWNSNVQILDLLVRLQHTAPAPDVHHTYFQEPCRFEDALGRILPVPPEYDYQMLKAIISARFSNGAGREKVIAGEYEIFNTSDTTQILSEYSTGLIPGMKITMAFVIGRYQARPMEDCPRPGCKTRTFTKLHTGGQACSSCGVWFDLSRKHIARPFRLVSTEHVFQTLRAERKWFKNVRICPTEIPSLAPTSDTMEFWVKRGGGQVPTQMRLTELDDAMRQENLRNAVLSLQASSEDKGALEEREAAAAQAIRLMSETAYLSVEELQDLAFNDFEPGMLGLDSLLMMEISVRLKKLGITPPRDDPANNTLVESLYVEYFIKDFVNEYWYCLNAS